MRGSRGGIVGGPDTPPLKNHKNIGFLGNTGPDPLKNHKATKPAFNVGNYRPTREMAFSWQADNCQLLVVFGASPPSKNLIRVGPPLTKLSGSTHVIIIIDEKCKKLAYHTHWPY